MIKEKTGYLVLFIFMIPFLSFSHSLEEGIKSIENDSSHLNKIIVYLNNDFDIRNNDVKFSGESINSIIGEKYPYRVGSLFSKSKSFYQMERANAKGFDKSLPHLENYIILQFEENLSKKESKSILIKLYSDKNIQFAYFHPKSYLAEYRDSDRTFLADNSNYNYSEEPTPDFQEKQFYLKPSPTGVDAEFGWTKVGGSGEDVKVIDIEGAWQKDHEDFPELFSDGSTSKTGGIDHGTAVLGIVAGRNNGEGITGIANKVQFGVYSVYNGNDVFDAKNFELAAENLEEGDLMIIELHRPGPDNRKYCPVENWQAIFDVFKVISSRGIIIVEAGGNGNSNLDGSAYEGRFDLSKRDSGAILVGAGGSIKAKSGHLKRLGFSNYGSRVDTFGYGDNVVTTGYGDLFNPAKNRKYTARFSGTSSASPLVTGSLASIQGIFKAQGTIIKPLEFRKALRETGTKSKGPKSENIGNMPDIKKLYEYFDK